MLRLNDLIKEYSFIVVSVCAVGTTTIIKSEVLKNENKRI